MNILDYPWEDEKFYINWLSQTFHYVRHSTRLTARAASLCSFAEPYPTLHNRFCRHLGEEFGHELLALKDLEAMDAHLLVETEETRNLYSPYYYAGIPEFLGYVLALEETAASHGLELLERVRAAHCYECVNFLRVHAFDDPAHVEEANKLVELLPAREYMLVQECREEALENYKRMLDACKERV